ncbi:MAG: hypothetical protein AAGF85_12345, partial [Bacteroidota bacterium]
EGMADIHDAALNQGKDILKWKFGLNTPGYIHQPLSDDTYDAEALSAVKAEHVALWKSIEKAKQEKNLGLEAEYRERYEQLDRFLKSDLLDGKNPRPLNAGDAMAKLGACLRKRKHRVTSRVEQYGFKELARCLNKCVLTGNRYFMFNNYTRSNWVLQSE